MTSNLYPFPIPRFTLARASWLISVLVGTSLTAIFAIFILNMVIGVNAYVLVYVLDFGFYVLVILSINMLILSISFAVYSVFLFLFGNLD